MTQYVTGSFTFVFCLLLCNTSTLHRFSGKMQPGITLRDLVNAIPYVALKRGLLTVEKKGKKNVYSGKIVEIEGLPDLKVCPARWL